jgi:hypothetical protein
MTMRHFALRCLALPTSLLFAAPALLAQSTAVLGKHNAAFLEGLWRAGYLDFADQLGKLVANSNLPADEKEQVKASHTKLRMAIAARDGNATERRQLALDTIATKEKALAAAAEGSDAAVDAMNELVESYRLFADAMAEALTQAQPDEQSKLRDEADKKFTAAEKDLEERTQRNEKLRSEDKPGSELPMLISMYGLGRLYYYHSLVFPNDSHTSEHLVDESLAKLEDFDLEFGDSLAAFEAKLTTALCHNRKGDRDLAIESCNGAISLRERFDKDRNGVYQVDRNAADVIAAGVLQKTMFLNDAKTPDKIVEATKDYFATIPSALEANQGLAVLVAQAKAQQELGDTEGATAAAHKLIELDPKGQWGYRGQELLSQLISGGSGGNIDTGKTLKIAESLAGQGEFEQALRMCREAILRAKTPEESNSAAEALLITGAIEASRGYFHEASVAFDAVVRRYPKAPVAPDALWRSIQCFLELEDLDGLPMYKKWREDRSQLLVKNYPDDPHVGQLQLIDGRRLEKAQKFVEAAAVYAKIAADSSVHVDATFYESSCYQKHARKLAADGMNKEAAEFETKAATGFRALIESLAAARAATTDNKQKARLDDVEFNTRIALASMLISGDDAAKVAEAEQLLQKVEAKGDDAQTLWALRIRIKVAKGNVDEAITDMDNALDKAGDSKPLLVVCRSLAMSLDNRAVEKFKQKERLGAGNIWRKAAVYYVRSAANATGSDALQIADRLLTIGMIVNDIPETVEAWYEVPEFKVKVPEPWEGALTIYVRQADAGAPYKARIGHARILGFLGRTAECESELTKLFTENKLAASNKRLDSALLAKRPELLTAYLEYGFALRTPVAGSDDKARRARATDVFDRVALSVPSDSRYWWFARFGQIQSYYDRGLYDEAHVVISSLERTNPQFDADSNAPNGRFGLKRRFESLKTAIEQKVPK